MPNKLSQFWQELKRRKVVRVITVYAAAAFVILELVDIVSPSLRLPEWTMNFIIVLLCVGFIIAVILSWIYDIHPEDGIVKTEPSQKVIEETVPPSSKGWKIASYISFIVIVGLIVFHILSRSGRLEELAVLDKSIAVLPFKNDSPDQEMYFINGTMEEILDNLCKIKDLRVISRNSVERYRDNLTPTPVIAEEINVSYILEGSGQRDGNNIRLTVQLLDARNDSHVWSDSYYRKIENIFDLQSDIAQLVAAEIKAIITPEEKQLIEKIPTTNLTAYDFYQRGKEEYWKYWLDNDNREALERAEDLYYYALDYDSTFALAYTGLAFVHLYKHYWETYMSEEFLDSVLVLANTALSFDSQLSEAYLIKGYYYTQTGKHDQAIKEFDSAIRLNPNDWWAYSGKAFLYDKSDNLVMSIKNHYKAASLNHDSELPVLLRNLCGKYIRAGFKDKAEYYNQEALKLDNDSAEYYYYLSFIEAYIHNNFEQAVDIGNRVFSFDSLTYTDFLYRIGRYCLYLGRHEESLQYFKKHINQIESAGGSVGDHSALIGYAYWKNGFKDEAEYYFNEQIKYSNRMIELDRESVNKFWTYYYLAGVYAFHGEIEKAIENLNSFNQRPKMCMGEPIYFKNDPIFDNIRNVPEFQRIVKDVEAKYQAEHERVRQWLEENGMLY